MAVSVAMMTVVVVVVLSFLICCFTLHPVGYCLSPAVLPREFDYVFPLLLKRLFGCIA